MAAHVRRVQNNCFLVVILLNCHVIPFVLSAPGGDGGQAFQNKNAPNNLNVNVGGAGQNGQLPNGQQQANLGFGQRQQQALGQQQGYGQQQPGQQRLEHQQLPNIQQAQRQAPVIGGKAHVAGNRMNIMLSTHPDCEDDIQELCDTNYLKKNNFAVLECLQSDLEIQAKVSEKCQHLVWEYKHNLTRDDRFELGASEVCKNVLEEITECKELKEGDGMRIPCLIENLDNITEPSCLKFLTKMESIVFGDYRLVYHFVQRCEDDIKKFKCGRLDSQGDKMHAQGPVIMCLAKNIGDLNNQCKKQVLRVAELQSDDYHHDRALYYACREAREIFCGEVHAGGGKVFECLFKHKMDRKMPDKCRELIRVRQQLISEDVRVKKTFYEACYRDIRQFNCMDRGTSVDGHAARSKVLLCLENAMKKDQKLSGLCIAEMTTLRKSLMEDYQVTPEIVCKCDTEIDKFCKKEDGLDRSGGTIHCLMQHANLHERQRQRPNVNQDELENEFRSQCKATIEDLLKEADVGDDVSIDVVLAEACADVLEDCAEGNKAEKGNGRANMMNCLMEKVDSDDMSETCEDRLLEIQYFIVRDYRLDPQLYRACHKDAVGLCSANDDWANQNNIPGVEVDAHVFPCLYRHMPFKIKQHREQMEENDQNQDRQGDLQHVSERCEREVKRVMRQRAKSIDLEPDIEEKCLTDLGALCSDPEHFGKGKEMLCLQDNYENIANEECREIMKEFIEDEEEDLDLDTILMKSCTPMIKKYCGDVLKGNAEASEVMDCLIENKNDREMNPKCRAGIEHHQIIQLKDFAFTHKFKEACKLDVMEHCKQKKTKAEIVTCLSEIVRDDVLTGGVSRVRDECQGQLRVELLHMGEDIKLDPELEDACGKDVKSHCAGKTAGNAQVIECLKEHRKELSPKCHRKLFQKEINEALQGGDFLLFKSCKTMIKTYCKHKEPSDVLKCLKNNMNHDEFDDKCKSVILKRAMDETKDYRLNPNLIKACRLDIPKFCKEVIGNEKRDEEYEGKIINCLKKRYIKKELSKDCTVEIRGTIKETHLDINMDPVLMHACETQIRTYCMEAIGEHELQSRLKFQPKDDAGDRVKNCLEEKLMEGKISIETQCGREISRIVEEVQIDVHIDPELNSACTSDLVRWCQEYESGQGQKMSCLLQMFEDHPDKMNTKCSTLLAKRKTLWEYAAKIAPPETFSEFHQQIMLSPAKNYILGVIMTVIGIIFIIGITCGRVTKRVTREQKNK